MRAHVHILLVALACCGASAPAAPKGAATQMAASPVIETIEFDGLSSEQQALVSSRLSVSPGDLLTAANKQRIAAGLRASGLELTFSYRAGPRYGTAVLKISAGC